MSSLTDKIRKAKKSMEIREEFKDIPGLKKKLKDLKENGKKIDEELGKPIKSDWDKIHETSDYKRYIYRVFEGKTFRGSNAELDEWIKTKFNR